MSKLIVEVSKIDKIEPHPNADRLVIASIRGWKCLVGINDYKEGDLVVFCPEDSVIPSDLIEKYKLEYLRKNGRLRAVKLRGVISQGLVLPIPEGKNWKLGKDVASELGIVKYEPPTPEFQTNLGNRKRTKKKLNPLFDRYTEIENIKNYNKVFKEGDMVVISEKVHGTNARFALLPRYKNNLWGRIKSWLFGKYEFVCGSHNVQITHHKNRHCFYGDDVWGQIAKKYNLKGTIPEDYIVYGEIFGSGIQKGYDYGLKNSIDFVVIDIKHNGSGRYLDWSEVVEFCRDKKLPIVPVLYVGQFSQEALEKCTKGQSILSPTQKIREGCVVKSVKEEYDIYVGRKILKSINPEYLLIKDRTDYK